MPIYKNESTTESIRVIDGNNNPKTLLPGEQTITNKYYDITDLTKISDEPFINPVAAYHKLTFSSASSQTITLTNPNIAKIRVQKADGNFDIFFQSESNTPAIIQNWTLDDYPIDIIVDGRCSQIIVKSNDPSGTIQVVELKDRW